MDVLLRNLAGLLLDIWPYAVCFTAIALATKRARIVEAIRRSSGEATTNALLLIFNALILVPLFVAPVTALEHWLGQYRLVSEESWAALPGLLTVILAILAIDFVAYWRHRFEHAGPIWRFHATHHADTTIHWLSVQRKHPIARLMSLFADLTLVWLIGVPVWAIFAAALIRGWWGYFIHADVPWTLGPLGKVLISPAAHRLHHIRDEQLMGHNFGNTFTLWDRLFGTYLDPAPYVDCETGIAEGTRGFFGELARPFEARYQWRRKTTPAPAEAEPEEAPA
ncbi:MAG: sterol desaturase family protein [Pseudomonadota bacterium]